MDKAIKKKLLFVMSSLSTGGAEVMTLHLLRNLNREKFSLHLAVFKKEGELLRSVPVDVKVYDFAKKTRWDFLKISCKLAILINKLSPDIVYSRMWYATALTGMAKILSFKRFYFVANEEHNHKRDLYGSGMASFLKKLSIDFFHRLPLLVVVPSRGVAMDLRKSYGLARHKINVIYNSVDITEVTRMAREDMQPAAILEAKAVISSLGRLIKRKGHETLIRSFARTGPPSGCLLLIIGEGEEDENLRKSAESAGVADRVVFAGYQKNPYGLIASSDIFILSSHREGFGIVIIEAMACGVAVISTRCPYGPDEIITDGVDGLLVPPGDEEAMAGAILKLFNDEPLRKRLAEAGRRRAEDFTVEKMVSEYEKVFDETARQDFSSSMEG